MTSNAKTFEPEGDDRPMPLDAVEQHRLIDQALASIERDGVISEAEMNDFFAETLADLRTR